MILLYFALGLIIFGLLFALASSLDRS